jgi:hypothetical protein
MADAKTQAGEFLEQLNKITKELREGSKVVPLTPSDPASPHLAIATGRLKGLQSGSLDHGQPDILDHLAAAMPSMVDQKKGALELIEKLAASPLTTNKPLSRAASQAR